MATKSSIHIKPCNISSSEAHNRRTAEYMRNIGESKIYVIPELSADNEQWINPGFGNPDLQAHYDHIKQMVKEKTGRAMQEKERERKGKNGKIIKVAGCSPIREGVLLIKPDTTLDDVRRFGEECQRRWGITPLQIFLHKDEGHWLNGQPDAEDRESFQVGEKWFKPNYHAHIVFDWMNHDTGKSRKLNDDDLVQMQTLASDILSMERGQSKAETGKEHLERNDFILEKQKTELQRMEAERRHKEQQIDIAEQELKQVKSEIRTDKLKSVATDTATALASSVGSLFGSGKMKSLERKNEDLQDRILELEEHARQREQHIKAMEQQQAKQIQEIKDAYEQRHRKISDFMDFVKCYFPYVEKLIPIINFLRDRLRFKDSTIRKLCEFKDVTISGSLYSSEFNQNFEAKHSVCSIKQEENGGYDFKIDGVSHVNWFRKKRDEWRETMGIPRPRQTQNRGIKL